MKKHQLKKQILQKEIQIKKLQLHQTTSDICNQLYNSLILEKNKKKKELENIKKIFCKKEKLICDYWNK